MTVLPKTEAEMAAMLRGAADVLESRPKPAAPERLPPNPKPPLGDSPGFIEDDGTPFWDRRFRRAGLTRAQFARWQLPNASPPPGLPEDARMADARWDYASQSFDCVVHSASFEAVPIGGIIPMVKP